MSLQKAMLPESTADPNPNPEDDPKLTAQDDSVDLDTVIYSFLNAFPEPTEEQAGNLASLLGFEYDAFRERILALLGQEISERFDPLNVVEDLGTNKDLIQDPLDLFLISYCLMNPSPTVEQIDELAPIIGLTPEVLDELIYKLLADLGREANVGEIETDDLDLSDTDLDDIEDDLDDLDEEDTEVI